MYKFYRSSVPISLSKEPKPEFSSRFKFRVRNYIKSILSKDEYIFSCDVIHYQRKRFKQWRVKVANLYGNIRVLGYINQGAYDRVFEAWLREDSDISLEEFTKSL